MGRRESGGKYLRARDLTSAKKLVILSYFPVVQGGECKKLARNILPSATVLPVHCAKKLIHIFPVVQEGLTSAKN